MERAELLICLEDQKVYHHLADGGDPIYREMVDNVLGSLRDTEPNDRLDFLGL